MNQTTNLIPKGRPPTMKDFKKAAMSDPVIASCLNMHKAGDFTEQEMLIAAALMLADGNRRLVNRLVEMSYRQKTVIIDNGTIREAK